MKDIPQTNPPYIPVKKISALLEKIASRAYEKIDRQTLIGYGFSEGEASQSVGTLTFLGIIKSDKTVNKELVASISVRNEDKKIEGIKNMIQDAYKDLFSAFPDAATADTDDIHDEIKRVYKLSSRIAKTAVPAFIYLCEAAGLRVKNDTTAIKPKSSPLPKQQKTTKPGDLAPVLHTQDSIVIDFARGAIKLILPQKVMTSPTLLDGYKTLVSALHTFVAKYDSEVKPPLDNNG